MRLRVNVRADSLRPLVQSGSVLAKLESEPRESPRAGARSKDGCENENYAQRGEGLCLRATNPRI